MAIRKNELLREKMKQIKKTEPQKEQYSEELNAIRKRKEAVHEIKGKIRSTIEKQKETESGRNVDCEWKNYESEFYKNNIRVFKNLGYSIQSFDDEINDCIYLAISKSTQLENGSWRKSSEKEEKFTKQDDRTKPVYIKLNNKDPKLVIPNPDFSKATTPEMRMKVRRFDYGLTKAMNHSSKSTDYKEVSLLNLESDMSIEDKISEELGKIEPEYVELWESCINQDKEKSLVSQEKDARCFDNCMESINDSVINNCFRQQYHTEDCKWQNVGNSMFSGEVYELAKLGLGGQSQTMKAPVHFLRSFKNLGQSIEFAMKEMVRKGETKSDDFRGGEDSLICLSDSTEVLDLPYDSDSRATIKHTSKTNSVYISFDPKEKKALVQVPETEAEKSMSFEDVKNMKERMQNCTEISLLPEDLEASKTGRNPNPLESKIVETLEGINPNYADLWTSLMERDDKDIVKRDAEKANKKDAYKQLGNAAQRTVTGNDIRKSSSLFGKLFSRGKDESQR